MHQCEEDRLARDQRTRTRTRDFQQDQTRVLTQTRIRICMSAGLWSEADWIEKNFAWHIERRWTVNLTEGQVRIAPFCRQVVELSWLTIDLHLRNIAHKSIYSKEEFHAKHELSFHRNRSENPA